MVWAHRRGLKGREFPRLPESLQLPVVLLTFCVDPPASPPGERAATSACTHHSTQKFAEHLLLLDTDRGQQCAPVSGGRWSWTDY